MLACVGNTHRETSLDATRMKWYEGGVRDLSYTILKQQGNTSPTNRNGFKWQEPTNYTQTMSTPTEGTVGNSDIAGS